MLNDNSYYLSESDLDDDPTLSLRDMEGDGVKMEVTDPINDPSSFAFNPLFMR